MTLICWNLLHILTYWNSILNALESSYDNVFFSRSAARLATGDISGALEDAKEASTLAPHYPQVTVIFIDIIKVEESLLRLQNFDQDLTACICLLYPLKMPNLPIFCCCSEWWNLPKEFPAIPCLNCSLRKKRQEFYLILSTSLFYPVLWYPAWPRTYMWMNFLVRSLSLVLLSSCLLFNMIILSFEILVTILLYNMYRDIFVRWCFHGHWQIWRSWGVLVNCFGVRPIYSSFQIIQDTIDIYIFLTWYGTCHLKLCTATWSFSIIPVRILLISYLQSILFLLFCYWSSLRIGWVWIFSFRRTWSSVFYYFELLVHCWSRL